MKINKVWKTNLENSMLTIKNLVKKSNYISIDTEFPGIVSHKKKITKELSKNQYQSLKCNVDLLNPIQLGLTFSNEEGEISETDGCWQFNFYFDLRNEMFAQDSIHLLLRSGVNFYEHKKKGIDVKKFSYLFLNSGLVSNHKIKWISFHSGYDFCYLIKILRNKLLPFNLNKFFKILRKFFPCFYDIKYVALYCQNLHGGLNKLAEKFKVLRFGPVHQAGSDSLITLKVFFKLKQRYPREIVENKHKGILYGLNQVSNKKIFVKKLITKSSYDRA